MKTGHLGNMIYIALLIDYDHDVSILGQEDLVSIRTIHNSEYFDQTLCRAGLSYSVHGGLLGA